MHLTEAVDHDSMKSDIPAFRPGDTVKVHVRVIEGSRERIQVFQGTVIRLRKGGANASFTVRRIATNNIGVERTYLLHSPRIEKVEVLKHAKVRRAQLYYFRKLMGKSARLKERLAVRPTVAKVVAPVATPVAVQSVETPAV